MAKVLGDDRGDLARGEGLPGTWRQFVADDSKLAGKPKLTNDLCQGAVAVALCVDAADAGGVGQTLGRGQAQKPAGAVAFQRGQRPDGGEVAKQDLVKAAAAFDHVAGQQRGAEDQDLPGVPQEPAHQHASRAVSACGSPAGKRSRRSSVRLVAAACPASTKAAARD